MANTLKVHSSFTNNHSCWWVVSGWVKELNLKSRSALFIKETTILSWFFFNEPVNRIHKSNCIILSWLNDPDVPRNTLRNTEHNLYWTTFLVLFWRHDYYELSLYGKNCVKIILFLFNGKKITLNKFGMKWGQIITEVSLLAKLFLSFYIAMWLSRYMPSE